MQKAAASLVTGARRCDHITPVLRQLHWLLIRQRVVFKIAGLVHKSLVGAASAYLADDCRLLSDVGCHPLRSNSNTIQYGYFNVRSKADISQLNLPHGTDN